MNGKHRKISWLNTTGSSVGTCTAFAHVGKGLFAACRMLGIEELFFNHPKGLPYPTENPF